MVQGLGWGGLVRREPRLPWGLQDTVRAEQWSRASCPCLWGGLAGQGLGLRLKMPDVKLSVICRGACLPSWKMAVTSFE